MPTERPIVSPDEPHFSAAADPAGAAAPIRADEAVEALRRGPVGALVLSAVSTGLLLVGWLLFYFLIFLRRGSIG